MRGSFTRGGLDGARRIDGRPSPARPCGQEPPQEGHTHEREKDQHDVLDIRSSKSVGSEGYSGSRRFTGSPDNPNTAMDTATTDADVPAPRPDPEPDRSQSTVLDPAPGGLAERLGTRWREHSPVLVGSAISLLGLVVLTAVIIGIGLLLTNVFAGGPIESWDNGVNDWFVSHRTPALDTATVYGSDAGGTLTIIAIAVVAVVVLGIARRWREVELIVVALTIEVSVFLLAALVVGRTRPDVPRLDVSPPTSSYPSGHTAATIALYVGLAIVVSSLTTSRSARVLAWTLALLLPVAVGLSRLYRGMHHPTDVLASVVLSAGALTIAVFAARTSSAIIRSRRPDQVPR